MLPVFYLYATWVFPGYISHYLQHAYYLCFTIMIFYLSTNNYATCIISMYFPYNTCVYVCYFSATDILTCVLLPKVYMCGFLLSFLYITSILYTFLFYIYILSVQQNGIFHTTMLAFHSSPITRCLY